MITRYLDYMLIVLSVLLSILLTLYGIVELLTGNQRFWHTFADAFVCLIGARAVYYTRAEKEHEEENDDTEQAAESGARNPHDRRAYGSRLR